jgi:hypothetical protein
MSTKRLSKTVIEGGRYGRNKYERRYSHVEVRAQERDYLKVVVNDPELADELDIDQLQPVYQGFTDKLAPMYRWLKAQVGRVWDEVRSEVFTKFDTRTTAGRHITFDHLLKEVVDTESGFDEYGRMADPNIPVERTGRGGYYSFSDYYVDQDGILQETTRNKRRYRYQSISEQEYKDVANWLNGRMIMEHQGALHWLTPSEGIWKASWIDPNKFYDNSRLYLKYYVLDNGMYETVELIKPAYDPTHPYSVKTKAHGNHWEMVENPFSFRLRGQLSSEEVKQFKALKDTFRADILAYSKGRG